MLKRKIQPSNHLVLAKRFYNVFHYPEYEKDNRLCDCCFEGFKKDDELLYCETCNSYAHARCLRITPETYTALTIGDLEDEYLFTFIKCEACQERELNLSKEILCEFCQRNDGLMRLLYFDEQLPGAKKNQKKQQNQDNDGDIKSMKGKRIFCHPLCMDWCDQLEELENNQLTVVNIREYRAKKKEDKFKTCSFCAKDQGYLLYLSCQNSSKITQNNCNGNDSITLSARRLDDYGGDCQRIYHPMCAAENNIIFYQPAMKLLAETDTPNKKNAKDTEDNNIEENQNQLLLCRKHLINKFNHLNMRSALNLQGNLHLQSCLLCNIRQIYNNIVLLSLLYIQKCGNYKLVQFLEMKEVFQPEENRVISDERKNETKYNSQKDKDKDVIQQQQLSQMTSAESQQRFKRFSQQDQFDDEKQKEMLEKSMKEYQEFMSLNKVKNDNERYNTLTVMEKSSLSPESASIPKQNTIISKKTTLQRNTTNKKRRRNSKGNNVVSSKEEEVKSEIDEKIYTNNEILNILDSSKKNFQFKQVDDAPNGMFNFTLQEEETCQQQQIGVSQQEISDGLIRQLNQQNNSQKQIETLKIQEITTVESEHQNQQQSSPSKQSSQLNSDSDQDKKGNQIASSSKQIDKIKWIIAQDLQQNTEIIEKNKGSLKKLEQVKELNMNQEKKQQKRLISNRKKLEIKVKVKEEEKEEIFLESAEEESNNDGEDNQKKKMKKVHLERCKQLNNSKNKQFENGDSENNNQVSSDNLELKNQQEKQKQKKSFVDNNDNDDDSNNLENQQKKDQGTDRNNDVKIEQKVEKDSVKIRKRRKSSVVKKQQVTGEKRQRRKYNSKGQQFENEEGKKNIVVPATSNGLEISKTEKGFGESTLKEKEVQNKKNNDKVNDKKIEQQELSRSSKQLDEDDDSKDLDDLLAWDDSYEEGQDQMILEKKEDTGKRKNCVERNDLVEEDSELNDLLMSDFSDSIDEKREKGRYKQYSQQSQGSLVSKKENRQNNRRSQEKIGREIDLMEDDDNALLEELLADSPVNNNINSKSQEERKNNNGCSYSERNQKMTELDQWKYKQKKAQWGNEEEEKPNQNRDKLQKQCQEEEDDDDDYLKLLDDDFSEEEEQDGGRDNNIKQKMQLQNQRQSQVEEDGDGEKIYMSDESSPDKNKDKINKQNMEVKSNNEGCLDEDSDVLSLLKDSDDDNGRIQDDVNNRNDCQNQGSEEKYEYMDLEGNITFDGKSKNSLLKFQENSKKQSNNYINRNLNYAKENENNNFQNSSQRQSQMSQGLLNSNGLLDDGSDLLSSQFSRSDNQPDSQHEYALNSNNNNNNSNNESNSQNKTSIRRQRNTNQSDKYQHEEDQSDGYISNEISRDRQIRIPMNNQLKKEEEPRKKFLFEIIEENKLLELEQRDKERRERLRKQQQYDQFKDDIKDNNNNNNHNNNQYQPHSQSSSNISRNNRSQSQYQDDDLFMSQFSQDYLKNPNWIASESYQSISNRLLESQKSQQSKNYQKQSQFSQQSIINSQKSINKQNGQSQSYTLNKDKSIISSCSASKLLDSQSVPSQTNNHCNDKNIDYLEIVRNQCDSMNSQKQQQQQSQLLSGFSQEIAGIIQSNQKENDKYNTIEEGSDKYLDFLNSQMNEDNKQDLSQSQKRYQKRQQYDNNDNHDWKGENELLSFGCQSQTNSDNRQKNQDSRRYNTWDQKKQYDSVGGQFRNRYSNNYQINNRYQTYQDRQQQQQYQQKQSLFKQSHKRKWKDCNFEDYSDEDYYTEDDYQQNNYWWQPQKRIEYWSQAYEIETKRRLNIEEEKMQRRKRMEVLKQQWEMKANKRQQKALEKQNNRKRYNNDDDQLYQDNRNNIQPVDEYLQYSRDRKRGRPRKYPIGVTGQRLMRIQKYKGKAIADNLRQTILSKKLNQEEANKLLEHHETGCIRRSNRGRYCRRDDNRFIGYGQEMNQNVYKRNYYSMDNRYRQTRLDFKPQRDHYGNNHWRNSSQSRSNSSSNEYMRLLYDTPSSLARSEQSDYDGLQHGSFVFSSERDQSFDEDTIMKIECKKKKQNINQIAKRQYNPYEFSYMAADEQYNLFDTVNSMDKLNEFLQVKTENYNEFFLSDDSKLKDHWVLGNKNGGQFYKRKSWRKSRRQEIQAMNRVLSQEIIEKFKHSMLEFQSAQSYCYENRLTALKGIKSRRKQLINNNSSNGNCEDGGRYINLLHRIPQENDSENEKDLCQTNGQETLETQKLAGQDDGNDKDNQMNEVIPVMNLTSEDQGINNNNNLSESQSDKDFMEMSLDSNDANVAQLEEDNNSEKLNIKENIVNLEMPQFYKLICSYKARLFGQ